MEVEKQEVISVVQERGDGGLGQIEGNGKRDKKEILCIDCNVRNQ